MDWNYAGGCYSLSYGDCHLQARLTPEMPMRPEEDELGSDEHPFVWLFEVYDAGGRCEVRGMRETLDEAQRAALQKADEVQADVLRLAEGF